MPQLPDFRPAKHAWVSQSGRGRGTRWALWEAVVKWSVITPNPNRNSNPHPNAKGGVSPPLVERSSSWLTCPSAAASNGWPALSGRPCSLLSTVWLSSSQSNIATGYRSPHSHRASFRKKTHTHTDRHISARTHTHTHTHTHFSHLAHFVRRTQSLCLPLSCTYILFKTLPHTEPLSGFTHTVTHTHTYTVLDKLYQAQTLSHTHHEQIEMSLL